MNMKQMKEKKISEGTILELEDGQQYLVAQVFADQFQFISREGNRWSDTVLYRHELQRAVALYGFKIVRQGGF